MVENKYGKKVGNDLFNPYSPTEYFSQVAARPVTLAASEVTDKEQQALLLQMQVQQVQPACSNK
jgi:hypothetical protein